MIGNSFLTRQTIRVVGTEWETAKRKSVSRSVRQIGEGRYEATLFNEIVAVQRRGGFWVIIK